MKVQVIAIANDQDYRAAKTLMESLMGAETDPEVSRLRAQALLIAAWEQAKSPTIPPDPVEAIKFRMEQMGLRPRDLVRTFGTRSRVSEVLAGKRRMSLPMIRRACRDLGLPAEVLIRSEVGRRRIEKSISGNRAKGEGRRPGATP
jgi:HTH-type transcriptional regulator/antitoxin HigA